MQLMLEFKFTLSAFMPERNNNLFSCTVYFKKKKACNNTLIVICTWIFFNFLFIIDLLLKGLLLCIMKNYQKYIFYQLFYQIAN